MDSISLTELLPQPEGQKTLYQTLAISIPLCQQELFQVMTMDGPVKREL